MNERDTSRVRARRAFAQVLSGSRLDMPMEDIGNVEWLVNVAKSEGVAALLAQRFASNPDIAGGILRVALGEAAREAAVIFMLREAECRKVLDVLQAEAVPVLLLKGSSLAYWLYPKSMLRECCDIDILVPSKTDADHAAALLGKHEYAKIYVPGDQGYEMLLTRRMFSGALRLDLDVHWRLVNAAMFAGAFDFDTLYTASMPLPALAPGARGLCPVHALIHACIHRAINLYTGIGERLKWLYDLHLLAQRFSDAEWQELHRVCSQHQLNGVCLAGIDAAADMFGNAAPTTALELLRASSAGEPLDAARLHEWKYMERRNFAALPSLRARAHWLWQRTFPSQGYLQELYGSRQGRIALLWRRFRRVLLRLRP